jgi:POT family proton-dependent oligopeptide transporter
MNDAAASASAVSTAPTSAAPTLFGQPRGLATLFLTEMWERFTYYGMRAVLILFMVAAVSKGGLGLDDKTASAIYGMYIGATYLFGLFGGWVADRLLGAQRAVSAGAVFIIAGNLMLALGSVAIFYLGLLVITVGVGLLKPNASVMVAGLYPEGGSRRDAGFSVFYMGINLGAFIGPLIVAEASDRFGWRWAFVASAIGMAIGLGQYHYTRHYLGSAGRGTADGKRGSWLPVMVLAAVAAVIAALP